jgi:hypothetical protein
MRFDREGVDDLYARWQCAGDEHSAH